MGQVVCIWCKTRGSVWRRRVFWMVGVVVTVIMVVDSNRVVRMYGVCIGRVRISASEGCG